MAPTPRPFTLFPLSGPTQHPSKSPHHLDTTTAQRPDPAASPRGLSPTAWALVRPLPLRSGRPGPHLERIVRSGDTGCFRLPRAPARPCRGGVSRPQAPQQEPQISEGKPVSAGNSQAHRYPPQESLSLSGWDSVLSPVTPDWTSLPRSSPVLTLTPPTRLLPRHKAPSGGLDTGWTRDPPIEPGPRHKRPGSACMTSTHTT